MTISRNLIASAALLVLLGGTAEARYRHSGSCDGIHRCRCGSTQTAHFGLPRIYHGHNLWLASEWARAFPHTSFHVGVVGVRPGHVLRVVGGSNCSSATVSDDAGTYRRNVCRMTFVSVNG